MTIAITTVNKAGVRRKHPDLDYFCLFNGRCDSRGAVYLKEGYWANISDTGALVTYFCPFKYCKCTRKDGLPGCLFDPEHIDDQCAKNREGWMCGKCKENTSVGLRYNEIFVFVLAVNGEATHWHCPYLPLPPLHCNISVGNLNYKHCNRGGKGGAGSVQE